MSFRRLLAATAVAVATIGTGAIVLSPELAAAGALCTHLYGSTYGCETILPDGTIDYYLMEGPSFP